MQNYFAAANTATGFVSWFDDIFDPKTIDKTYIIKGGSGTGKSTLMKKIAAKAAAAGASCENFYCSADPDSLDGILLTYKDGRTLAVIDGTAPHTRDPRYPGAAEEIVNLGEFWNADKLAAHRSEIVELCDKKSALYTAAYRDLAVAGELTRRALREAERFLLADKLAAAAERLLTQKMREQHVRGSKNPVRRIRALSAISTKGAVSFDSFADASLTCLAVDAAGTSPYLFDALIAAADRLGLDYDRAPMPLLPDKTEALRFAALDMAVVSKTERTEDVKPLNMARFIDRDALADCDRSRRRLLKKTACELTDAALDKLASIRRLHADVEAIYIAAMDFPALEKSTQSLLHQI